MRRELIDWMIKEGFSESIATPLSWVILILAVIIVSWLANWLARKILVVGIQYFVRRSKTKWDDFLLERKFFARLSHLAPALVIYAAAGLFGSWQSFIERMSMVYMIMAGLGVFFGFLNALEDIYQTYDVSRQRPIKGYVQLTKIIIAVFITIVAIAIAMNRSPWLLVSGLGAMTAVLILVFKDSILGLVASVQISANDMVRIGDWIEMPKFGADGDVIDITLHTVKIRNWDKTITTIPAYAMISDSFKNWRGMSESGGRRIARSVRIDMSSIKFLDEKTIERFRHYQLITKYIDDKLIDIDKFNQETGADTTELINGRRLTNVGTFRAYIWSYLHKHPKIHKDMTFLVRQLEPTDSGLPIQIYVFSNDQDWINYEGIQADIFDHILAVLPLFDLQVFQKPSGYDVRSLAGTITKQ
ncbi:MAG TPA: mechanosensitive ion channel [candidate division Zixibacteria bacterium]|nr:mechanosensitive ion channel [candidate division Zixibacteria bacterium]